MSDGQNSNDGQNKINEKLEKELPYKPCCKKIIWCSIVFFSLLVAFIVCSVLFGTNETNEISIVILTIFSLLTICSFIFYTIILIKGDCGIRFAKLNELARISEKIDIDTKNKKNCKFELYKKYMDTLADI